MPIQFKVIGSLPEKSQRLVNTVYLKKSDWDDYHFKTSFDLYYNDERNALHEVGVTKIGFIGQQAHSRTHEKLSLVFNSVDENYFSLGESAEFYQNIYRLGIPVFSKILRGLNDLVFNQKMLDDIEKENVLNDSLLRFVSKTSIKGQFQRLLDGGALLTDYEFYYKMNTQELDLLLEFKVEESSTPSTNIHALIGRNGSGKTTLLNNMIQSITEDAEKNYFCTKKRKWVSKAHNITEDYEFPKIKSDFFSRLVSVSFSAFDSFTPPPIRLQALSGYSGYAYIGLKDEHGNIKNREKLIEDFGNAIEICQHEKAKIWLNSVKTLASDTNFARMNLSDVIADDPLEQITKATEAMQNMSTGHAIVLLTITELIAKVEEKTLVLIDEPESHLHPPLLSAFIRTLSDLLIYRNGVAIIATHSPVVLQEIPKSCVYKITRFEEDTKVTRPDIETFGENVGTLTRDVFGLEVSDSGFYNMLKSDVDEGKSFEIIEREYGGQLGLEARKHLLTLLSKRDTNND